jgi:hypothetical protein
VEQLVRALCDQKQACGNLRRATWPEVLHLNRITCAFVGAFVGGTMVEGCLICVHNGTAGVHTVWWPEALWGVLAVRGLGQDRQVPAVPKQPIRQL